MPRRAPKKITDSFERITDSFEKVKRAHDRARKQPNYAKRRAVALVVLAVVGGGAMWGGTKLAALTDGSSAEDSGPAPQTIRKAAWGLTEHDGESMFPYYRDLGIGLFQTQVRWDLTAPREPKDPTNPNDPAYVWPTYLNPILKQAKRYGMEVTIQIIAAPKWANGGRNYNWPAKDANDFGDFAEAISRRYPEVRHWMILGEPNSRRGFAPVVDGPMSPTARLNGKQRIAPQLYAEIVDAAYGSLKQVNPRNLVIGGNTYLSTGHPVIRPYQWIDYMKLPNGQRPRMDMWGHNPYSYRKPFLENPPSENGTVDFSDLERLTAALDKTFSGPPMKLFLSEWGVPTGLDKDLQLEVDEDAAVNWVTSAFDIVESWDRIYTLGWSVPVDTDRNPQGLLDSDLEEKPTYEAFKDG